MLSTRKAGALIAGCLLATGGASLNQARAATPAVPNLTATVTSNPTSVSPPGKVALYRFKVVNNGTLPALLVTITDTTTNGAVIASTLSPGCSASGNTVTCSVQTLLPGQAFEGKVGVRSQTAPGSITNTVTASGFLPDGDPADNTASVTTPVVNDPSARALVLPGESLSQVSSVVNQTISVPTAPTVTGAFARLADFTTPPAGFGNGAIADMSEDQDYFARDRANPISWTVQFASEDPCNGNGNPTCTGIAYLESPTDTTPETVPYCPGYGGEPGGAGSGVLGPTQKVCMNDIVKVRNKFRYFMKILSNDPIVIPPLSGFGNISG